jgi:DNA transformation protein
MAADTSLAHFEELFEPLRDVTFRKMFGGIGIFKDGIMFALVSEGDLYLKGDERTSIDFAAEGSGQWTYPGMRGKATAMPYWRLPDRLLDDPDEFAEWARKAFAVAQQTRKPKKKTAAGAAKAQRKLS